MLIGEEQRVWEEGLLGSNADVSGPALGAVYFPHEAKFQLPESSAYLMWRTGVNLGLVL